jgi:hypothetical protein
LEKSEKVVFGAEIEQNLGRKCTELGKLKTKTIDKTALAQTQAEKIHS